MDGTGLRKGLAVKTKGEEAFTVLSSPTAKHYHKELTMNTTQYATPYTLDAEWLAAINEALATPATVPFAIEPCVMAVYDTMHGRPMAPEAYYRTVKDAEEYIVSYKAAVAASAEHVATVNDGTLQAIIDYGDTASELEDAREDESFWRWGC
jgi:hypothetical protein